MRRHPMVAAVVVALLLLAQLVYLGSRSSQGLLPKPHPVDLGARGLSSRVVFILLDSWALRVLDDAELMPRLYARKAQAASGVLWAPRVTGTMQGMLALSTANPPSGADTLDLFRSPTYPDWTIFDDLVAQHRRVMFHGGPGWANLFGERAPGSFRYTGSGPHHREDDLEAIAHFEAAARSPNPPALSLIHISETDHAAHQYGTRAAAYRDVLRFWDARLDDLVGRALQPGTTVIVTSDHGNDDYGTHGGDGEIFRRVPVLMWGAGVRPGSTFVMQATDMPATLAVLLGTRAPGGVAAMPATAALKLAPRDELGVALKAWRAIEPVARQAGDGPREAWRASLERIEAAAAALDEGDAGGAAALAEELRGAQARVLPLLEPHRRLSPVELAVAAATFVAAALLLHRALAAVEPQADRRPRRRIWIALVLAVEVLAVPRFSGAEAIKAGLADAGGRVGLVAATALLGTAALAVVAWRRRRRLAATLQAHGYATVVLGYLAATATLPFSVVALMALAGVAVYALGRPWAAAHKAAVPAAVALWFLAAQHVGWRIVSESPSWRYGLGLATAALLGAGIAMLDRRGPREPAMPWPARTGLVALALLMLLFPYGRINLDVLLDAPRGLLSVGALVLLTAAAVRRGAATSTLPAPLTTLLFWHFGQDWALGVMFAVHALCAAVAMAQVSDEARPVSAYLLIGSLLLGLSSNAHAISAGLFLVLPLALQRWSPPGRHAALAAALVAVFLVNLRYALFDLYGYVDSPISGYVLKHLDLSSAYLGSGASGLARGTGLVLLKVWLAGAAVVVALDLAPAWRPWATAAAATGAAALLFNIGQMALRAGLSVGPLTARFDLYTFSLFVHTAILALAASAYLAWRLAMRRSTAVQPQASTTWQDV